MAPSTDTRTRLLLLLLVSTLLVGAGAGCWVYHDHDPEVRFENYTADLVDVYIDGHYEATLGPFATLTVEVRPGYHDLYAEDEFGGDWGPITIYVGYDDRFIYELRP